jgi:LysM repeat protein
MQWDRVQVAGASAAALDSDIAVVSRFRDNMEVWWFGPGDGVHGAFWYDDGQGWRGPYQLPGPVGPASTGAIAAASRIATSMETWWIGADLSVRGDFWYENGDSWQPYRDPVAAPTAAAPTTGVAALSRISTSMEIWWIGLGGTVQGAFWYQDQNNNAWQRYTLTDPGTASDQSGVAAVSRIPTAMEIWWVGPQGSVEGAYWYATDPDPQWRRYQVAPEGSAAQSHGIAAVSRKPTSMDVVWISPDGGVAGAYWNEGDEWEPYPDVIADPGSATLDGGLAAVSRDATGLEVWWIGPDGSVQGATWTDGVGWHRDPDPVAPDGSAATTSGIAAMARTADTTEVWWIGPDGSVQLAVRDETSSGPRSFRILRPDDMVDLQCDVIGCRLVPGTGGQQTSPGLPTTYEVQSGDTLWDISNRFYGDPFKYWVIADANHIANPDVIDVGQQLTIPSLGDPPPSARTLVAVDEGAHIVVHFGIQHIFEERFPDGTTPAVPARARAADPSRVVFELPKGTEIPFTAAGVLAALTTLGLRVAPLAIPAVTPDDPRPPTAAGPATAPADDQTAIEAPYRLVVSPDATYGGFSHAAQPVVPEHDSSRVELWHSRLGVRIADGGTFRVDEDDDDHRTVRPVWTRDRDIPTGPGFDGSLSPTDRDAFVKQSAEPTGGVEPPPFTVERLYLSSLGAWVDWRVAWGPDDDPSAYRHLATLGRDQYVRVERPIYLFPFGHRATLIEITERKIDPNATNPAAYLFKRQFIVLREHTKRYDAPATTNFPFVSVTVDPVTSPDLDNLPDDPFDPFVPQVKDASRQPPVDTHYLWKITAVDHIGRQVTMTSALLAVPVIRDPEKLPTQPKPPAPEWVNQVVTPDGLIDLHDAEVAFAPETNRGDTTSRVKYLELTGTAQPDTSTPSMYAAHITIPALAALNRGGLTSAVAYHKNYVGTGFQLGDPAQLYLQLANQTKLDFAGGSDRGGGFIEPSVPVMALSRALGSVGDDGSQPGGITTGQFDPAQFVGKAFPKLFGLINLVEILVGDNLTAAPKLVTDQLGFIATAQTEYGNLAAALQKAADMLATQAAAPGLPDNIKQRYVALQAQTEQAVQGLPPQLIQPLLDALADVATGANPAQKPANDILTALNGVAPLLASPDLPAFLRSVIGRSQQSLLTVLNTATAVAGDVDKLLDALHSPVQSGAIHYDWYPTIQSWPTHGTKLFVPKGDGKNLAISVDVRTAPDGTPQADVTAQLSNFDLQLELIAMKFGRVGFRLATGGKPEVDVQFNGMEFINSLAFIENLRKVIPIDGFTDPPYVDVTPAGATAGFDLALPSLAIGVFSLQNISIGADCRVPFLGDAVTVGFNFCTKEAPFRLTVMAIGGGGWVGIRLSPTGLVQLDMGLEAGAALSVNLGVASGSVSVMVGVYLRLQDQGGQLGGYFRIRGEVEVLGIASASITLELSLTYDMNTGKLIGRASLRIEIEIAFFSTSVEITCQKQLAGSKGDPALIDVIPPDDGGQDIWDHYYSSFAIGA